MTDVVLDARMIRHSGIGTYLRGLVGEYQHHPFFEKYSFALGGQTFPFRSPIYSIQEQIEYPFHLKQCRLWHSPHYNIPWFKGKPRLVVTIHDLIHWIFRGQFYSTLQAAYAQFLIRKAISLADRIIAVSQNTREDLIRHFKAPPEKIRVIYEGVSSEFFSPQDAQERNKFLKKYGLPEQFFLYVGLIKPHKNLKRLLAVFRKLYREGKIQSNLVLVGKKDYKYPPGFEELEQLKTEGGIYYFPAAGTEKELHFFYASARALVHPSLYEGFGLTILEAMASGTPVILSRVSSLPEVAGEAGHYIDPQSDLSISDALLKLEQGDGLRSELIRRGKEQAKKFTWSRAAEETIQVYEGVL